MATLGMLGNAGLHVILKMELIHNTVSTRLKASSVTNQICYFFSFGDHI